jgi:hypothetical protein
MLRDRFFVTHKRLSGWTYDQAAVRLAYAADKFLKVPAGFIHPQGNWELTCFPFARYVDCALNSAHVDYIRMKVRELLDFRDPRGTFYTRQGLATRLKQELLYPPYPFDMGGLDMKAWGIEMFGKGFGFNPHS